MDVHDWIESGILEAYVQGSATEAERREVEEMVHLHASVKAELEALELLFENMGQASAIAPPTQVYDKINYTLFGRQDSVKTATPFTAVRGVWSNNRLYRMAAVSVGILCLGSLGINIYMAGRMQSMHNSMATLSQKQDTLSKLVAVNKHLKDSLAHQLFMAYNPHMKMVHLMGTPQQPTNHVMVYWDMDTKDVYVHIDRLPAPQPGMQYQLWAIRDGKPMDAGMITDGDMLKLKTIDGNVQAFAVTLEKAGGSHTPTMGSMYVMGKV
jgi:anti-sigma-K factor RskA